MPTGSKDKHHRRKSTGKENHSDKRIVHVEAGSIKSPLYYPVHGVIKMSLAAPKPGRAIASSSNLSNVDVARIFPEPGDGGLSASNPVSPVKPHAAFSQISEKSVSGDEHSLTLTRADGSEKTFHILSQLTPADRKALEEHHPDVAKKIVGNNSGEADIDIPRLGQGTFSFVSLARDNSGLFYAVRAVLNENELPRQIATVEGQSALTTSNVPEIKLSASDDSELSAPLIPLVPRGKVLLDTMSEIEVHSVLKNHGLDDTLLLIKDAVVVQNSDGIQIYQFLPLADLGNGLDIINKVSYLDVKDRKQLFYYVFQKLIPSMVKIHAANTAINDIKPENILFTRDAQVSFSDFGAACYLDNSGKLKVTSTLNDNRYSAPYSAMPISPGLTIKNRAHRLIEYNKRVLHRNQRCDLWSLALTLLQFWEPGMVEEFYEAAINRRYSPIPIKTPGMPLTQFSMFRRVVANDYSNPVPEMVISTNEASPEPSEKYPSAEQVIAIYKEELQHYIFSSPAFNTLPNSFRMLFRSMLQLEEEINLKESLCDMLSINLFPTKVESGVLAEALHKMLKSQGLLDGDDRVLSLFHKFQTLPNRRFNLDLLNVIKGRILHLSEKLPEIDAVWRALEKCSTERYMDEVLPVVLGLKALQKTVEERDSVSYRFLVIMESFCHGELPYEVMLNSLSGLISDLEDGESLVFSLM
jgi:serine/threonine protein kinase